MSVTVPQAATQPAAIMLAADGASRHGARRGATDRGSRSKDPDPVRFATFNASLNRNLPGQALSDLSAAIRPE